MASFFCRQRRIGWPGISAFGRILLILQKQLTIMDKEYLDNFERRVLDELLRLCTSYHRLDGTLLASDDIDEKWREMAPEYMADAVEQIRDYPTVSVAWAAYLGMAVAYGWDVDWATIQKADYQSFYGEQGFDDMDEHIVRDILCLPLDSEEAADIERTVRRCAQTVIDSIRREQIEPQSELAFHVFARGVRAAYRIGAALELKRLGYKFERLGDA